jgi:hypothetical protein
MKKQYHFEELSEKTCITPGCGKRLKKNLVTKRPTAVRCYACHNVFVVIRKYAKRITKKEFHSPNP